MNTHVCCYRGQMIEVKAKTIDAARVKGIRQLKPPKRQQGMLHVVLSKVDGRAVIAPIFD